MIPQLKHILPRHPLPLAFLFWMGGLSPLILAGEAHAVPRYTAQYGQSCTLCHTNPTGGGLRTEYASQYLIPEEIAGQGWT
nr:hypothetical protein [Candidatus Krumholzibacteria bacterium]